MCYFPRYIKNPRYRTQKRKYDFGAIDDPRKEYVAIGCGNCIECRRQKAQSWRVRLTEEIKIHKYAHFVTLTFSNEELIKLAKENKMYLEKTNEYYANGVATLAVRRFLERYRKKYGHSLKHWLITELGHENTERIHLHGILFRDDQPMTNEELTTLWKYGIIDIGEYCNQQTINYIVKYVTKIDIDHKNYNPVILSSPGIGAAFVDTIGAKNTYKYIKGESAEYYTLPNGRKVALPIYYRNKLYTEKERGELWTDKLDKQVMYVDGIKIRNIGSEKSTEYYFNLLKSKQAENTAMGYGSTADEWKMEKYNITYKMLQSAEKCKKK